MECLVCATQNYLNDLPTLLSRLHLPQTTWERWVLCLTLRVTLVLVTIALPLCRVDGISCSFGRVWSALLPLAHVWGGDHGWPTPWSCAVLLFVSPTNCVPTVGGQARSAMATWPPPPVIVAVIVAQKPLTHWMVPVVVWFVLCAWSVLAWVIDGEEAADNLMVGNQLKVRWAVYVAFGTLINTMSTPRIV